MAGLPGGFVTMLRGLDTGRLLPFRLPLSLAVGRVGSLAHLVVGDVEFSTVAPVARAISPVPGGVGPVMPMVVLRQTVEAPERAVPPRPRP